MTATTTVTSSEHRHHPGDDPRAELLQQLAEASETLRSSDGWQRWLATAAKFRVYSVSNQLLILAQHPDASKVAGYRAWQAMGRHVRKGERGIRILAPCVVKREDEDGGEVKRLVGFRAVSVFDVSQTDGADLPSMEFPVVTVEDESLFETIAAIARANRIAVEMVDEGHGSARGWYSPSDREISVVSTYDVGSRTRTLLHELAHSQDDEVVTAPHARPERELVAESAAYLVGVAMGVNTSTASAFYVTSWAKDRDELQRVAEKSLVVAERVESMLRSGGGLEMAR